MQFDTSDFFRDLTTWSMTSGLSIIGILIGSVLIWKLSHTIVANIIRKAIKPSRSLSKDAEKKREDTLISIFNYTFTIGLIIVAFTMILSEFGIATGPLIAIGSIAGVALGFGGQYIIKDFISGFFIILENQYRIGDVVCIGNTCGLVENITLRETILRDMDGTVHHVSNGEIKISSNLSTNFANVNLNITVEYTTNIEKIQSLLDTIGEKMAKEKDWKEKIIEAPHFFRINDFSPSGMVIKVVGKTQPLAQWDVTAELRKRIKHAFDKNNIKFALPQVVIHKEVDTNK